jgi:Xaa-Pro dipeptidase
VTARAFSREEYEGRIDSARAAMRDAGLEALLIFDQSSLYYLFGYDQIGYWVFQTVLLPVDGEPVAVARKADEWMIRETGLLPDVRIWLDDPDRDPMSIIVGALADRALAGTRRRVGIELKSHALLPYYYDALRSELESSVTLVDASDLVGNLRHVKSAAEIAYMRRAGEIMDAAFHAGFDALSAGARECDVHAAIAHTLYSRGGDPPAVPPPIASGARTMSQTHGSATEHVMQAGEAVTIEIGAPYKRYHAVGLRSAILGHADTRLQRLHEGLVSGLDAGQERIRPGASTVDVATATLDGLESHGVSRRGRHVGYGIGIGYPPTWLEPLRLKLTDPYTLEPGMTFFHFVGAPTEAEDVYLAVGDPILVTATGYEPLSHLPRELWMR